MHTLTSDTGLAYNIYAVISSWLYCMQCIQRKLLIYMSNVIEKKSIKALVYKKIFLLLLILLFEDCPNYTMHFIYAYSNFIHRDQFIMTNVNVLFKKKLNMAAWTIFSK